MKPDWKDAPEWANWLAMDEDGEWYWYEVKPILVDFGWDSMKGEVRYARKSFSWKESKEKRP